MTSLPCCSGDDLNEVLVEEEEKTLLAQPQLQPIVPLAFNPSLLRLRPE